MEDQQPAAGDLTEPAPEETPSPTDAEGRAAVDPDTASADPADDNAGEEPADAAPHGNPSGKSHWFARNRGRVLVGICAALFVGAGAFAGAAVQPYLAARAAVDTKLDIARTAADAITTLWTYTPDDMDKLPDRSAKFLSGDFQEQYRKYVDAIAPTNKQAKVTNSTQVVGAAVESLQGSEATALVYTNTTSTSPLTKNIPSMKYLSYRLELKRQGAHWRVTRMTTVTSLDITPQL